MEVEPHIDANLPPRAHARQRSLEAGDETAAEGGAATYSRSLVMVALALAVLVVSLYLMSRFPDMGAVIEQYNKF